jgi:hypothetical protein
MRHEEGHWCLKYQSLWLKEGDQNTNLFHKKTKARHSKNNVREVFLEDASKITKFESLKEEAKQHGNSLYMQQDEAVLDNVEDMLNPIPKIITNKENRDLVRPIEEYETKNAIWILELDKAPRPNGFSISFFRFSLDLIKI